MAWPGWSFTKFRKNKTNQADVAGELVVAALDQFAEFGGGVDAGAGGDGALLGQVEESAGFLGDGLFGGFHERAECRFEAGLGVLLGGRGCVGDFFQAFGFAFANELAEGCDCGEEVGDFLEGAETAEAFEGGDCQGHLGLVVVIWVVLGVFGVELPSESLVGMGLDRQSLVDGQNLEEKGKFLVVLLRNLGAHQRLIVGNKVE